MIDTLTKLQRLGISYLLTEYASKHITDLKNGGTIYFINNYVGDYVTMYARVKNQKYPIIECVLEMKEEINSRVEYEFDYDSDIRMFRIYEKGGQS